MNRRSLLKGIVAALLTTAVKPLRLFAGVSAPQNTRWDQMLMKPPAPFVIPVKYTKLTELITPYHEAIQLAANRAEELKAHFEQERVFIFQSHYEDQIVFPCYSTESGAPLSTQVLYVWHMPIGTEKDLDGGALPGPHEARRMPHGSTVYGVPITDKTTPHTLDGMIDEAVELVKGLSAIQTPFTVSSLKAQGFVFPFEMTGFDEFQNLKQG
jgi:hypothetical protein